MKFCIVVYGQIPDCVFTNMSLARKFDRFDLMDICVSGI